MNNFLDVSELNRKQQIHRTMKSLTVALTVFATAFIVATCLVGVGVFARLVWYLITWGWSAF